RDRNVTGVQTCALPIWIVRTAAGRPGSAWVMFCSRARIAVAGAAAGSCSAGGTDGAGATVAVTVGGTDCPGGSAGNGAAGWAGIDRQTGVEGKVGHGKG